MYYTLIHNKDVAFKGFLRGCRPTRLNHVILVFSVFLFYVSPLASTLTYITWYNTSLLIIIFIFNIGDKAMAKALRIEMGRWGLHEEGYLCSKNTY